MAENGTLYKRAYAGLPGSGYRPYRLRMAYHGYPAGTRVYVRPSLCVAYQYWLWFADELVYDSALKNFDALFQPLPTDRAELIPPASVPYRKNTLVGINSEGEGDAHV